MTDAINTSSTSVAELRNWLIGRVSTYGEIPPEDFTVDTPLVELGFNSVYALTLCGDIEDTYDIDADPSLIWDNSTIAELASAIDEMLHA